MRPMEEGAPDRTGDTPDALLARGLASTPLPHGGAGHVSLRRRRRRAFGPGPPGTADPRKGSPLAERVRWLRARVGWDDRHERLAEHPLLSGLRRSEIR